MVSVDGTGSVGVSYASAIISMLPRMKPVINSGPSSVERKRIEATYGVVVSR